MILSVVEFVHCKPRSYCKIWMDCVYAIVCTIIWECKTWFYHPCHNRVNFKRNWKRTNKTFYKVIYRVIDLEIILVDILDRTVSPKKLVLPRAAACSEVCKLEPLLFHCGGPGTDATCVLEYGPLSSLFDRGEDKFQKEINA